MKLFKLIFSAIVVMGLSSCLGNTSNSITQDFSNYCLSYVVDSNTGNSLLSKGATFKVYNNIDNGTMTLEISNLKLPNSSFMSLKIEDQRYSYNESGAMVLRVPSYTSTVAGMSHTVTDLKFEYYSRYLGQNAFPMLVMSYNIDSQYSVRVVYNPGYYWGTTRVTDQDGNEFVNKDQTSFYGISFDADTKKATFAAFGAKFADKMPALNMTFSEIPFTLNQYSYTASIDELIPKIGETSYPNYKITNFRMDGSWGGQQSLNFTCTIYDTKKDEDGKVVLGDIKGVYNVNAQLSIMPPKTTTGN